VGSYQQLHSYLREESRVSREVIPSAAIWDQGDGSNRFRLKGPFEAAQPNARWDLIERSYTECLPPFAATPFY